MRINRGFTILLVLAIIATPILAKKSKAKGSNSSSGSGSRQKEDRRRGKGSSSEKGSGEIRKPEINVQGRFFADTSKPCVDSLAACRIYLIRGLCRFETYTRICPKSCNKCRPEVGSQTDLSSRSQLEEADVKLNKEGNRLQKDSRGIGSESRKHKGQGLDSQERDEGEESRKNGNAGNFAAQFSKRIKGLFKSRPNERNSGEKRVKDSAEKSVKGDSGGERVKGDSGEKRVKGHSEEKRVKKDSREKSVKIVSGEKRAKGDSGEKRVKEDSGEKQLKLDPRERGHKIGSLEEDVEVSGDDKGGQIINGARRYIDWFRGLPGAKSGSNEEERSEFLNSVEKNNKLAKDRREVKPGSEERVKTIGSGKHGIISGSGEMQTAPENKGKGIGSKIVSGAKKYINWFHGRGTKSGSSVEESNQQEDNEEKPLSLEANKDGNGNRILSGVKRYVDWFRGRGSRMGSGKEETKPELGETEIKSTSEKLSPGESKITPLSGDESKAMSTGSKIVSGARKYIDWLRERGSKMGSGKGETEPELGETEIKSTSEKLSPDESKITPLSWDEGRDMSTGSKIVSGARKYIDWLRERGSKMGSYREDTEPELDGKVIISPSDQINSDFGSEEKGNVLPSGEGETTRPDNEKKNKGFGNKIVSGVKKYIDWFRGRGKTPGSSLESSPITNSKATTTGAEEVMSQNQEIDDLMLPEAVRAPGKADEDDVKEGGIGQKIVSGAKRILDWFQDQGTKGGSSDVPNETVDHNEEVLSQTQLGEEARVLKDVEPHLRNEESIFVNPNQGQTGNGSPVPEASDGDEEYFRQEEFIFPEPKPQPLGMESGVIPDDLITASSYEISHGPEKSRPNSGSAWKPSASLANGSFLQVDLGEAMLVHGLGTLGDPTNQQWTRAYKVSTSTDGQTFADLLDTRDNKTVRIFSGNKDGSSWAHHCLHRYYGNPVQARYIRFSPVDWSGSPSLRVEAFGYRRHNDPLLVKALEKDAWTKNVTGCMCYYDNTKFDCACCQPSGCQCPSNNRHQCVQCGYGSSCGVPDAKPRSVQVDGWTKTETGCACHWDQSRTDCACCQNNGCQCGRNNKNQCFSCGHPDQCGAKEDIFGPNSYCAPKTCTPDTAVANR